MGQLCSFCLSFKSDEEDEPLLNDAQTQLTDIVKKTELTFIDLSNNPHSERHRVSVIEESESTEEKSMLTADMIRASLPRRLSVDTKALKAARKVNAIISAFKYKANEELVVQF